MVTLVTKEIISSKDNARLIKEISAAQVQKAPAIQSAVTAINTRWGLTWLIWASGGFMFLAFTILEMNSIPKPKIKPGRIYTIEKVISHNYRDHTVVLNHDENIELFRCRYVSDFDSLRTDKEYTVQQINDDLFFTLA